MASSAVAEFFSDFERQKQQHSVVHPYDMQVLSRMMVEISMADGHLIKSEREWLMLLLNPAQGTLGANRTVPPSYQSGTFNCSCGRRTSYHDYDCVCSSDM